MTGSRAEVLARVAALEEERHPRWVWWSAAGTAAPLVRTGIQVNRCWDVLEVHRLVRGGWRDRPDARVGGCARASTRRGCPALPAATCSTSPAVPRTVTRAIRDSPVRRDGYLRPEAADGSWLTTPRSGCTAGRPRPCRPRPLQQQALATCATAGDEHRPLGVGRRAALRRAGAGGPADPPPDAGAADPRRRRAPPPGRGPRPRRSGAERDAAVLALTHRDGRAPTCATRCRCASCSPRSGSSYRTRGPGGSSRSGPPTRSWRRCSPGARRSGSPRRTAGRGWTPTSARTTGCAAGGARATARADG